MDRLPLKRSRPLRDYAGGAYVSQTALRNLLTTVENEGVPKHYSRYKQYSERKQACNVDTPYGKLVEPFGLPLIADLDPARRVHARDIAIQNPLAMLWYICSESEPFAEFMQECLRVHPAGSSASPWRLVFYLDEVTPSDTQTKHDVRKTYAFYWSFLEFGAAALACEDLWFTIGIIRTAVVKQIPFGLPQIVKAFLRRMFGDGGFDLSRSGIVLNFPGGVSARLFARFSALLADYVALKFCADCKGHAGTVPCFACRNVLNKFARRHAEANPDVFVTIDSTEVHKFIPQTDAQIRSVMESMQDFPLTGAAIDRRAQFCGMNANPESIYLDTHPQHHL